MRTIALLIVLAVVIIFALYRKGDVRRVSRFLEPISHWKLATSSG